MWRDQLIALLDQTKVSAYNPVVPNWTPECQAEEIRQRETSDYCLYVITPKMTGVYSIAESVDDSNKRPAKTVFCFLEKDELATFEKHQVKSLAATGKMIAAKGGKWLNNLKEVADFLNA